MVKLALEVEHIYVVKPVDYKEIVEKAFKVDSIEQWEIKSKHSTDLEKVRGTVRVRSTNGNKFTMAVKKFIPGTIETVEEETLITEAMFETFKMIAPMGSVKKRYHIQEDGYVVEVDVYFDKDGNPTEYCKVDIEVKDASIEEPEIPFATDRVIGGTRTDEEEEFVKDVFVNMFQIYQENSILPIDDGTLL